MKASRELDALVAKKVMGFRVLSTWDADGTPKHVIDANQCEVDTAYWPPAYSTDIAAAWEVVEKTKLLDTYVLTRAYAGEKWQVIEMGGDWQNPIATGDSAPHAICLAALKAVGK